MSYLFAAHAVGAISDSELNSFMVEAGVAAIVGIGGALLYVGYHTLKEKFWRHK